MTKITLKKKLLEDKCLSCNIIVSSILIKELELYGFVNSCSDDWLVKKYHGKDKNGITVYKHQLKGVVNKDCGNLIIVSDYLYQVFEYQSGSSVGVEGKQTPIYKSIIMSTKKMELRLEDLWMPSLLTNDFYLQVKTSNRQNRQPINDESIRKAGLPQNISVVDGEAILTVDEGAFLMIDSFSEITSVGEDMLAVCRYINPVHGGLCYAIYGLDELYCEL